MGLKNYSQCTYGTDSCTRHRSRFKCSGLQDTSQRFHAMIEGNFDFNKNPLAPTGTKVILHEKPNRRRTWFQHGVQGWHIVPEVEHYRCYKVNISNTTAEHIIDAVELFPENTTIPGIYSVNAATYAATELISALKNPAPAVPFAP